ncbi:MAG: efflux RND transporter permease subunit [Candidatus Omnitrophota bacterium]
MSLPSISVRRPTAVSMFFVGIVLVGIITFRLLPVEMMPNISFGDITINIDVRGGIPASEVEKRIAIPVEEAVGSVTHLKNILAISKEGNATIILEFEPGTNMDFAALEVREKFNRIRNELPPEIEKPVIAKYEYMDVPIMILAVTSENRTPEELRKIVDDRIKDRIQRIEGVARAEVAGGREGKIIIEVDERRLQAYSISINRIVDIINANNANLLAGEIKRSKDKYLIRTIGEFKNLNDMQDLAIATTKEGSVIRLKDVAAVKNSYLDPVAFARMNARPVVSIYIQKESNANTVKIAEAVEKELKLLRGTVEKDISLTATFNQAEAIKQAVTQVQSSLLYGAILASLTLLLFMRSPYSIFVIASSIPLAVLFAFCLMFFSKLTINVMTLSGLALGVGMLVDNAIVVLDNTFKKREEAFLSGQLENLNPLQRNELAKELAISGADEIFMAISASTLTTLIVFVPLIFINQEIKMLYSGIALTITYSLLASLLAAITLVPMLLGRLRFKGQPKPEKPNANPQNETRDETPAAEKNSDSTEAAPAPKTTSLSERFRLFYKGLISLCLSLRYLIVMIVVICFALALKESRKLETEFIGIAEQNKFTIHVEMPTGTRLEVSDRVVAKIEQVVSRLPEVKTATSKVEPWSSKIYVELTPLSKRKKTTAEVMDELRPFTDKMEPAFIYYEEPEEVGTKEILIEIYGYDYDVLKKLAMQIAQRIQSIPKFTDTKIRMREGRPEMHLVINKKDAAMFGLTTEDIALAIHTHMRGLVATHFRGSDADEPVLRLKEESPSTIRPPDFSYTPEEQQLKESLRRIDKMLPELPNKETKQTETIVRLEEKFRRTFDDLRRLSLITPDGRHIYLSQVAAFKFEYGPSEIWRKNKSRMVQVSANTGGIALGTAAEKVKQVMAGFNMPKDYFWEIGGNYDKMVRNQNELSFALILSLVLVYMILAGLFESLTEPFIILVTVPLGAIGAIIALRITDKAVGIGVLIGAIMLAGIVVNNAIVLIDRLNYLRHKFSSESGRAAVIAASYDRLRPIMMTSLTTILGLIPMALDKSESSSLWSPLAITVIGGMLLSTFLTLFVTPCVYMIFRDLRLIKK